MHDLTERLDKFLANSGVCARRAVENFLSQNIVTLNGKRVTEAGVRIQPKADKVIINGSELKKPELKYYLLNKPAGYISTVSDPHAKYTVVSLFPKDIRLYPIGRLDKDTTGLLILTNDGELTNLLTHPRYEKNKTYKLTINGFVSDQQIQNMRKGIRLEDGITAPAKVVVIDSNKNENILEMTIHEGRNRQIRRMCKAIGINLTQLERVAIGNLRDSSLKPGKYRELTKKEIEGLANLRNSQI